MSLDITTTIGYSVHVREELKRIFIVEDFSLSRQGLKQNDTYIASIREDLASKVSMSSFSRLRVLVLPRIRGPQIMALT